MSCPGSHQEPPCTSACSALPYLVETASPQERRRLGREPFGIDVDPGLSCTGSAAYFALMKGDDYVDDPTGTS
jgi:hypothetical protein